MRACLAVIAMLLVSAASCDPNWGEVTETDRQRTAALRADPVFTDLTVREDPGQYREQVLIRSTVRARIPDHAATPYELTDLAELRRRGLGLLDAAGWTFYRFQCAGTPLNWTGWAYRKAGGVSYLLRVTSTAKRNSYDAGARWEGSIDVEAIGPHVKEAADLPPENPPAVAAPCPRSARPATAVQGLDVVFDSSGRTSEPSPTGPTR